MNFSYRGFIESTFSFIILTNGTCRDGMIYLSHLIKVKLTYIEEKVKYGEHDQKGR